jgi:hypothetical protein
MIFLQVFIKFDQGISEKCVGQTFGGRKKERKKKKKNNNNPAPLLPKTVAPNLGSTQVPIPGQTTPTRAPVLGNLII